MTENVYYEKGKTYWETIPATISGMLGGFTSVSTSDIQASSRFLTSLQKDKNNPVGNEKALDCGAGIGRVTKLLLTKFFQSVDMVEQNKAFLDAAKQYIGENAWKVENLFNSGLQEFVPQPYTYDVIWIQWVIGYLTDEDFVLFLKRCKSGLKDSGVIVIKDNLSSGELDVDHEDGSVTRPKASVLKMFQEAGLTIVAEKKQVKFPKGLYEVRMFALR